MYKYIVFLNLPDIFCGVQMDDSKFSAMYTCSLNIVAFFKI
jgi:hypothetical protein